MAEKGKKLKKAAETGEKKMSLKDVANKLELEKFTKQCTEQLNKKIKACKKSASSEDILSGPKEYIQTLLFPEEAENIKQGTETEKAKKNGPIYESEYPEQDRTDISYEGYDVTEDIEELITEMDEIEKHKHTEDLSREMRKVCREEIEREKNSWKGRVTFAVCAGVFFSFFLLYTTAITFNNMRYLGDLHSDISDLQGAVIHESHALNNKVNKIDEFIGMTARQRHMKKIQSTSPVKGERLQNAMFLGQEADKAAMPIVSDFNGMNRRNENIGRDVKGQPFNPAEQQKIQEPVRYAKQEVPAESLEQQASRTNVVLAGITYDMYSRTPLGDRLNILATHFRTNTVLMEYMFRTMAVNSGIITDPSNAKQTEEQIRQNLKAILDTKAGKKMLGIYNLWQMAANDPEILAEIDVKLLENGFYGLAFIPAVENALLN